MSVDLDSAPPVGADLGVDELTNDIDMAPCAPDRGSKNEEPASAVEADAGSSGAERHTVVRCEMTERCAELARVCGVRGDNKDSRVGEGGAMSFMVRLVDQNAFERE